MKNVIFIILLLLFSLQVLAYQEVKEKGFLRVAVYKNNAPFAYLDKGLLKGLDVELGKLLAKKMGVDSHIWMIGADENMEDDLRNAVWKGHYLGGGTADVMLHVPVHEAFATNNKQVLIANAYFTEQIIVARPSSTKGVGINKLFSDHKIGVELDTLSDFFLLGTQGGRFRENVIHYETVSSAVQAMINGEIKAVVAPKSQINFALMDQREDYLLSNVIMPRSYQSSWQVGMAVKNGREELMALLVKALDEIKSSGELEEMFKKYGLDQPE